ncbi:MAG: 50S ribosomal protein L24 [Deltaproteobacteria bacterium]|jgi:large subunit ribosomal protein L24|nr:50S ribosomal protein L24 [Deltaproteobacteria bacterium]MCK5255861.1 50S ribosomal protein L24 [Deltaproteobacteria bacterium]
MPAKLRIKKNDQVKVIAGKEKGKTGKILTVMPKKGCVIIEKVNFVKRHTRPSGQARQGGILEKEAPIHISNVMVVCNKCNSPVRVGQKALEDGKKARYCKKCGELLDL